MKKLPLILLATVMVAFTSCDLLKDTIKDKFAVTITYEADPMTFELPTLEAVLPTLAPTKASGEVILFDQTLDMNIAQIVEDEGHSFERLKKLAMEEATLEPAEGVEFDMNTLQDIKLYIGQTPELIASADKVVNNVLYIKVTNPELLDLLKNDQIRIVLTGKQSSLPSETVNLVLKTKYQIQVSVFKDK